MLLYGDERYTLNISKIKQVFSKGLTFRHQKIVKKKTNGLKKNRWFRVLLDKKENELDEV